MPVARPPTTDRPDGRRFAVVAVLAVVVIAGLVGWMVGRHDGRDAIVRDEQRFPTPTTVAPSTTVASPAPTTVVAATPPPTTAPTSPPTTPPAATAPATPAPTTTVSGVVVGGGSTTTVAVPVDPALIARLVPNLAAFTDSLTTPDQAKAQIDQLLASGRHDVAAPGPVGTICAAVKMGQPLAIKSRWERDGRRIASSDLGRRDAPGFGECLGNDGKPLEDGSYQYVAIDSEGHESAAGGIVVGAARIDQRFTNGGTEPVCTIRIAPSVSRYFEVYVYTAAPIAPGATVTLPVADVGQDVETVGCSPTATDGALATFSFHPSATVVQPLKP